MPAVAARESVRGGRTDYVGTHLGETVVGEVSMIRRLVLDVLKPHEPDLVAFTGRLGDLECVEGATAKVVEMDENVQTVRVAVEGTDLEFDSVRAEIDDLGGSIHSTDEVSAGERIVDDEWVSGP